MTYLNDDPLTDLADPDTPPPRAVDPRGQSAQRFIVDVHVIAGSLERRAMARGRDIYAITAPLVAEATQQLFSDENIAGVLTPAELLPAVTVLKRLARAYNDLHITITP